MSTKTQRPTKKGPYRVTVLMLRQAARSAITCATHSGDAGLNASAYARWQNLENEFAAERGIAARVVS